MVATYTITRKSEVFNCLKDYKTMAESFHGLGLARLRCDQGGEYCSNQLREYCSAEGILLEYHEAYSPELNGVAERMNRTLVEKAKAMLFDSNLPKEMWTEAISTATVLTNRSPTTAVENKTPYRIMV